MKKVVTADRGKESAPTPDSGRMNVGWVAMARLAAMQYYKNSHCNQDLASPLHSWKRLHTCTQNCNFLHRLRIDTYDMEAAESPAAKAEHFDIHLHLR